MLRAVAAAVALAAGAAIAVPVNRTAAVLEQAFFAAGDPALTRIASVVAAHGGVSFSVLSLKTWDGDLAPNETSPLPPPDADAVALLQAARYLGPAPLRVWGGVSLCPGPAYACMLNYTQSAVVGAQLAARVAAAGLDGVVIYVSPYCNNANCKRTTGKYAEGIAALVSAFRSAAPEGVDIDIALPLNEWDNPQIVAQAAHPPAAIFSWQTVYYFTSIGDCVKDCGSLCGAGEGGTYMSRANRTAAGVLQYLAAHDIRWVGMFAGASTPEAENPADLWPALAAYANGSLGADDASSSSTTRDAAAHAITAPSSPSPPPAPVLALPIIGDWGGQGDAPFTRPGELAAASAMGAVVAGWPAGTVGGVLAVGDNLYPMGACNDASLPPYNDTCPGRNASGAGTADDPRFQATFEQVFTAPSLHDTPFWLVAGNQDALGNVSASIAYSALSTRWRHPGFWFSLSTAPVPPGRGWRPGDGGGGPVNGVVLPIHSAPLPGGASLEILMIDVTLCYGIWSDPAHAALCDEQLAWLEAKLAASTASFLLVAGHYPVWSGCAHGSTQWAIDALLPAMLAHNVTAYMSGHDHCGEFLAPGDAAAAGDFVTLVSGMGDGCCYGEPNVDGLPSGALKYLLSDAYNPANASAGFAVLRVDDMVGGDGSGNGRAVISFEFRAADAVGSVLYTSPRLLPRTPVRAANGSIIAMAAPDYAAAGLPRPSAAEPAGNYTSTLAAVGVGAAAGIERLPLPGHGAPHDEAFEATLWLYAPTADNDTWAGWFADVGSHVSNLTGVSPCLYEMDATGAFVYQLPNASAFALARNWTSRFASELGLRVRPLLAASGTGMNRAIFDADVAAAFINATLAEAAALGLSGYNVQLEEPGNATIAAAWLAFLGAWLDAAAGQGNLTISIIIGGDCRGKDWMYLDCGDYRVLGQSRRNLRVITEATYTGEPSTWKDYLSNIVRGLGVPMAAPGLEYGPPLLRPGINGCLPAAAAAGVRELYVWVDPPAGDNATIAGAWDSLGWWVAGASGTPPGGDVDV